MQTNAFRHENYDGPTQRAIYQVAAEVLDQHMRRIDAQAILQMSQCVEDANRAVAKVSNQAASEIAERDREISDLRKELKERTDDTINLRYEIAQMAAEQCRMSIALHELVDPDYEVDEEDLKALESNMKLLEEQFNSTKKTKKGSQADGSKGK
ncbi:Hypothetical predicted protein [Lecanosticta acicola]|uniref:Uncharacterized protein n=1 Tax=Lecanosticta acicola TaxID=111012 RepID=A0AAI8YRZ9_9PEZI|nr:Hypothetical predicted protein [Lecanosticta acicola]